jgi:hypothetical protein
MMMIFICTGSVTARLSGTMFYTSAIASLVLSSKLYLQWNTLTAAWVSIERSINVNMEPDKTLKKRMAATVITMAVLSIRK